MKKPSTREWMLLSLAPLVIFAAAAMQEKDADSPAGFTPSRHAGTGSQAVQISGLEELDVSKLRREARPARAANAFESMSWIVPIAPVDVSRAMVTAPSAPPLPFTYLGRFQGAGDQVIFLVKGDRVLSVSTGEIIEGVYRVEGISGATLALIYLPLNIRQSLDIGVAG